MTTGAHAEGHRPAVLFSDLRRRNERRARVGQLLENRRQHQLKVARVMQAQRERRVRQDA